MAYTSGFTAVTGATFLASQYNTYVRDNLTALWVFTTAGDLIYATSSTTATRLGIGASGSVLYSSGSAPAWSSLVGMFTNFAVLSGQAIGDMIYASATNSIARLAIGASRTLIQSSGTSPFWDSLVNLLQNAAMVASQAAGDIFYATSTTAIARLAKGAAFQRLRMNSGATAPEWASFYGLIPFKTASAANTSWNGDAHGTGTTTISATAFTGGDSAIPSTAKAVLATISAKWAGPDDSFTCNLSADDAIGSNGLLVRAQTSFFQDASGIVPLNASGQFDIKISGLGVDAIYIDIWGYFQ